MELLWLISVFCRVAVWIGRRGVLRLMIMKKIDYILIAIWQKYLFFRHGIQVQDCLSL